MKHFKKIIILIAFLFLSGCSDSNTFKVTFNTNGGSDIESIETEGKLTLPSNPVKEGYTFNGWYFDSEEKEPYDNQEITSDITLYASWTKNKYTLSFEENGGEIIADLKLDYQDDIPALNNPVREGHEFLGWYTDKEFKNEFEQNTKIISDMTLYAKWQTNKYKVTFKDYDGTVLDETSVYYQRKATTKVVPEREGYTFTGWDKDFSKIESDLVVTACYEQITFDITFNLTIGGYKIIDLSDRTVPYGGTYSFRIEIYIGYTPSWKIQPFIERGLDRELIEPVDGIYTISDVKEDMSIYVQSRGESNVEDIIISGARDMVVGETINLTFEIIASSETSQVGTWSSSDESIATVDENGKVTALKEGEVTIYLLAFDMKAREEVIIKVE